MKQETLMKHWRQLDADIQELEQACRVAKLILVTPSMMRALIHFQKEMNKYAWGETPAMTSKSPLFLHGLPVIEVNLHTKKPFCVLDDKALGLLANLRELFPARSDADPEFAALLVQQKQEIARFHAEGRYPVIGKLAKDYYGSLNKNNSSETE